MGGEQGVIYAASNKLVLHGYLFGIGMIWNDDELVCTYVQSSFIRNVPFFV